MKMKYVTVFHTRTEVYSVMTLEKAKRWPRTASFFFAEERAAPSEIQAISNEINDLISLVRSYSKMLNTRLLRITCINDPYSPDYYKVIDSFINRVENISKILDQLDQLIKLRDLC